MAWQEAIRRHQRQVNLQALAEEYFAPMATDSERLVLGIRVRRQAWPHAGFVVAGKLYPSAITAARAVHKLAHSGGKKRKATSGWTGREVTTDGGVHRRVTPRAFFPDGKISAHLQPPDDDQDLAYFDRKRERKLAEAVADLRRVLK